MTIKVDFEREYIMDQMYIIEAQQEMEQEFRQREHRKAAEIVLIKIEKDENHIQPSTTTA